MAWPTWIIEWATAEGVNPGTWSDETSRVMSLSVKRGRDDWLSDTQPGSADLIVTNADSRFSIGHASAASHVKLMRAVRIRATHSAVTYPVFFGYVESVTPLPSRSQQVARVRLVDGFGWLALVQTSANPASALTGTVIGDILDEQDETSTAVWPAGRRSIDAGQSTVDPSYSDTTTLSQLQDIAANEAGLLVMGKDGSVVFEDRHHRFKDNGGGADDHLTAQYTFHRDPTTGGITGGLFDLAAEWPVRDIANIVKVSYNGGTTTKSDSTSRTSYGPRRLNITADLISANEGSDRADWTLQERKDARARPILTLHSRDSGMLTALLDMEISDRIKVQDPAGAGYPAETGIDGEYFVEGIGFTATKEDELITMQLQLSEATAQQYWILDDTTLSKLDGTTGCRLAY